MTEPAYHSHGVEDNDLSKREAFNLIVDHIFKQEQTSKERKMERTSTIFVDTEKVDLAICPLRLFFG